MHVPYLTIIGLLLIGACSLESKIERREDRLIGTWQIEKAFFKEDGDWFRDNRRDEFAGDRVTFYADYTLLYDDRDGRVYDGRWRLSADRISNDGEGDVEYFLDADFYDDFGRPAFSWLGNITRLSHHTMRIFLAERSGRLELRLDKLD